MDRRCRALRRGRYPETIGFLTTPEIALEQVQAACAAGLPRGVVLMDAGYGTNTRLREEISALGLSYVAGIPPQSSIWPPGTAPLPPLPWSGRGRRPKLMRRDAEHHPVGEGACARPAGGKLADDFLARGKRGSAEFALCPGSGAGRPSRRVAGRAAG